MYYKLNDKKEPVQIEMMEWAKLMSNANERIVKKDYHNDVLISTVFLGLDHRFGNDGPPILFETMLFGSDYDEYQERYSTWKDAEEGHEKALALVKAAYPTEKPQ